MDITSILGMIVGFAFILFGIFESGKISYFFDVPSLLIVIGGTIGAIVASFPFKLLKGIGKHFLIICSSKKYDPKPVIEQLVSFAQIARKDGLLALESQANELTDPFLKKSIMYIVDVVEADKLREMLQADIENTCQRHAESMEIYGKGSSYAPAFGMIGTLIGLINMLRSMNLSSGANDDLGKNMSVALVTTFYGCVLANLVFNPIAAKLAIRDQEERIYKEIIVEGVLGIQEGDNPKNLKEHLVSVLSQKQQNKLLAESDDNR